MKIDSHQHFWIVDRFDYPWLSPKLGSLYRDYQPDDLKPLLRNAGIDKTIVVQASPSVAETDWLLELAVQHDFIAGVVGWLDVNAPDFARQFTLYRKKPKFVGLRPAVEFIPDDAWLAQPKVIEKLAMVVESDSPLDLIVWPRHLPAVVRLLERLPLLRCVVDHLAKPDLKQKPLDEWRKWMTEIASHPHAYCKLSGLPTKNADEARPFVEHIVDCFSAKRVMFGSDWPVSLRVGDYKQSVDFIRHITANVPEQDLLGETAAHFYKLGLA